MNGNNSEILTADNGILYKLKQNNTVAVAGYRGSHGNITIPASFKRYPVTEILPSAFTCNSSLRVNRLSIPSSVKKIGTGAIPNGNGFEEVNEEAAFWADAQRDPWARKEYGLYDPIKVELKAVPIVQVVRGSYAERYCKEKKIHCSVK